VPGGKFGPKEELLKIVDEDGLLEDLHCYKPVPWAPSIRSSTSNPPFTGYLIYVLMTRVALSGRFDISENIYGLPAPRTINRYTAGSSRRIPMFTWTSGMLLVTFRVISLYLPLTAFQLGREQSSQGHRLPNRPSHIRTWPTTPTTL
jgi:hypothetical protein